MQSITKSKEQFDKDKIATMVKFFINAKKENIKWEEYRKSIISDIRLKGKVEPVEKALHDAIRKLLANNIKVIALTALSTGKFGNIRLL